MLQSFGYGPNGESLVHDTGRILAEMLEQKSPPDPATEVGKRVIRQLFSDAHAKCGGSKGGYSQLESDLREYVGTGCLPYDVMRTWFAMKYGDQAIPEHIAIGSKPAPAHAV